MNSVLDLCWITDKLSIHPVDSTASNCFESILRDLRFSGPSTLVGSRSEPLATELTSAKCSEFWSNETALMIAQGSSGFKSASIDYTQYTAKLNKNFDSKSLSQTVK